MYIQLYCCSEFLIAPLGCSGCELLLWEAVNRPGTFREPRGRGMSAVGSRYQATSSEILTDWEDLLCPIVVYEICRTVRAHSLLEIARCRSPINPITDPTPSVVAKIVIILTGLFIQYVDVTFSNHHPTVNSCMWTECLFSIWEEFELTAFIDAPAQHKLLDYWVFGLHPSSVILNNVLETGYISAVRWEVGDTCSVWAVIKISS
jgi:hypothetical protein